MMMAGCPDKEDEADAGAEEGGAPWAGETDGLDTQKGEYCAYGGWKLWHPAAGHAGRRRKGGKHDRSKTPGRPGQGANLGPALHRSDLFCLM